ncbi:helix-turn-helix domain-containing protein [Mycobacterium malmoense]|uniref:helix-turn-helix domain-containing protein n=1 Tax=Mycobacterium malmoense TaxID=1780 RepID=UPI0009F4E861
MCDDPRQCLVSVSAQHGLFVTIDDALFIADRLDEICDRTNPAPARLAHLSRRLRQACVSLTPTQENTAPERPNHLRGVPFDPDPSDYARYGLVETDEAARTLGCSTANVRDLIRRGRLPARHVGRRWLVSSRAVVELAERKAAGRA